jgi:hypothetical protein
VKVSDLLVVPEGNHGIMHENTVKMQYYGTNTLAAGTLERFPLMNEYS